MRKEYEMVFIVKPIEKKAIRSSNPKNWKHYHR